MPDFWDESSKIFLDAKLSSWTVFSSTSLEKYLPHCDKLIVVYLRGEEITHDIPKLELRHVSYYYPALMESGNSGHIARFEEIMRDSYAESVPEVVAA